MAAAGVRFLASVPTEGCELQIGGSDQWGNITAGIELVGKREGQQTSRPRLSPHHDASGAKFGKSEAGNIWLDRPRPARTSSISSGSTPTIAMSSATSSCSPFSRWTRSPEPWPSTRATRESDGAAAARRRYDDAGTWCGRGGAGDGNQRDLFDGGGTGNGSLGDGAARATVSRSRLPEGLRSWIFCWQAHSRDRRLMRGAAFRVGALHQ